MSAPVSSAFSTAAQDAEVVAEEAALAVTGAAVDTWRRRVAPRARVDALAKVETRVAVQAIVLCRISRDASKVNGSPRRFEDRIGIKKLRLHAVWLADQSDFSAPAVRQPVTNRRGNKKIERAENGVFFHGRTSV